MEPRHCVVQLTGTTTIMIEGCLILMAISSCQMAHDVREMKQAAEKRAVLEIPLRIEHEQPAQDKQT